MATDPLAVDQITRAMRANARATLLTELQAPHLELLERRDGKVASYIPELARVDPEPSGLAVATTSGYVIGAGDARSTFTIQSVSKPFVQGLVLKAVGRERYRAAVGVEPSGDAFNAIELDEANGRPYNPMVNAGAIASVALVPGDSAATSRPASSVRRPGSGSCCSNWDRPTSRSARCWPLAARRCRPA